MLTDPRRANIAASAIVFATAAPLFYVVQRVYEIWRGVPIDPSLILLSTHNAYLWRAMVATWSAGGLAIVAYTFLSRSGHERPPAPLVKRSVQIAAASGIVFALLAWQLP